MAFNSAPGYGNLPRGNWSPTIFSKKTQQFFRTVSVVNSVTNTDYSGEISDFGDTVQIIKEPLITVGDYVRGQEGNPQDLDDQALSLVIDQAHYFMFQVDDIEKQMSHVNWGSLAQSSAAYALTDKFDTAVLSYMHSNASTNATLGASGSPKTIGYGSSNDYTPLDYINRLATIMDENDVPDDGRYIVASPAFYEQLGREDGKLIEAQVTNDPESLLRNRKFGTSRMIHGFTMFKTTNNPLSANSDVTIMAGHRSAVSTATAITKSESMRREKTFAELYKGLLVYGRKVLRPEALFTGFISLGDV